MKTRFLIVIVGMLAAIGLVAWVGPREFQDQETWNISSTRPEGAKAFADLLKALGMPVTITRTLPQTPDAPVLILDDFYGERHEQDILDYARRGGTVVQVAGDRLWRAQGLNANEHISTPVGLKKTCDWPELADVDLIRAEDTELYETFGPSEFCFTRDKHAWLVREQVGTGRIYTLGNGMAFVNKLIEADDNAILAVRLLEPDGRPHQRVYRYKPVDPIEAPDSNIVDLLPNWVWVALVQSLVAFGVLAYGRLIRPARVMHEHLMTQLPGATPVVAFGHYLWTTKRIGAVADMARNDLLTRLRVHFSVAESQSISLIEMVAHATQMPYEQVEYVLFGPAPTDRKTLYDLTLAIAEIDQAIAAGPRSITA